MSQSSKATVRYLKTAKQRADSISDVAIAEGQLAIATLVWVGLGTLVCAGLILVTWVTASALFGVALLHAGLPLYGVLSIGFLIHLAIVIAIARRVDQLLRSLTFPHTRRLLHWVGKVADQAPEKGGCDAGNA